MTRRVVYVSCSTLMRLDDPVIITYAMSGALANRGPCPPIRPSIATAARACSAAGE